jgi:serine/threonine protein phosphatase 1
MPGRILAIGDVHGCLTAFRAVLDAICPGPEDTLVTLGDYVDRGPESRQVIEQLIALARQTQLVPLLGNHDEMMVDVCSGRADLFADWLLFGGNATLASYGTLTPSKVPAEHLDFLRNCRLFHQTPRHFFVHATYRANLPVDQQPRELLLWESLKISRPGPHVSGKTAIVGHTSQKSGDILDLGYLKCIDTWCYGDGWLTAMDVETDEIWQANREGKRRR